jgi:hypothetical protein
MQRTLAGLPFIMPGMGDEIDGAMQHAPHPARHDISTFICHTLADNHVLSIEPARNCFLMLQRTKHCRELA